MLDNPEKFDYTTIRKALCLQTTSSLPDQSRENDRSAWNSEAVIFSCVFYRHVPHPFLPRPGTSPGSKKPPCWYLAARRFLLLSYKSKNKSGISNRFSGRITNLFCSSPRIFQGGNLNRKRPCATRFLPEKNFSLLYFFCWFRRSYLFIFIKLNAPEDVAHPNI